jgi:small GTP-binding protein
MKENGDQEEELNDQLLISKEKEENLKSSKMSIGSKHSNSFVSQEMSIESLPDDSNKYNKSIKVILLGDTNVGKSSIVNCLKQDENLQRKTISLEVYNYTIKIKSLILRMQIWDTVGQEKFDSVATNYYKITDVAIFVYAINDINSFNNIDHWFNELNNKGDTDIENNDNNDDYSSSEKTIIKVLVGNKKDLEKQRQVSFEQGKKLCKEKNFDFFMEINSNSANEGIFDVVEFKSRSNNITNNRANHSYSLPSLLGKESNFSFMVGLFLVNFLISSSGN